MSVGDEKPEKVRISNGAVVTDAYVDFNMGVTNPPELVAITDGPIGNGDWMPIEEDPDDDFWLVENDYGLFQGWQEALPVSEETGAQTYEVKHADLGLVERYRALHHVVANKQNTVEEDSEIGVTYHRTIQGSPRTITTRVEAAQKIIERYINGPLGLDTTSFWWELRSPRGPYAWREASKSKDHWEGYEEPNVQLVADRTYTWHPKRTGDVTADDEVFEP